LKLPFRVAEGDCRILRAFAFVNWWPAPRWLELISDRLESLRKTMGFLTWPGIGTGDEHD